MKSFRIGIKNFKNRCFKVYRKFEKEIQNILYIEIPCTLIFNHDSGQIEECANTPTLCTTTGFRIEMYAVAKFFTTTTTTKHFLTHVYFSRLQ